MSTGSTLLLAVLTVAVMAGVVSAFSLRPEATWNYYHFNGSGFSAGQPADQRPFMAVRDHVLPVVMLRMAKVEAVALPPATGALAGICYIQSSGGKLGGGRGYSPSPRTPLTMYSGQTVVLLTQSDDSGYFVAVLPDGAYHVVSGAFTAEAIVEKGTTTLVPLQTGKRMVD
jgi:hypothetical protein